jgi:hypothetical protein
MKEGEEAMLVQRQITLQVHPIYLITHCKGAIRTTTTIIATLFKAMVH